VRLVNTPDGIVDVFDRAIWLTPPFDIRIGLLESTGGLTCESSQLWLFGPDRAKVVSEVIEAGEAFIFGSVKTIEVN
jgi:hypothetical protein